MNGAPSWPAAPEFPDWLAELALDAEHHLLVREQRIDRWWRIWPDRTRSLVGYYGDVERLVRSWLAWTDPPPVWSEELRCWVQPPSEYVGPHYTIARVDPAVLERWPDVGDVHLEKESRRA